MRTTLGSSSRFARLGGRTPTLADPATSGPRNSPGIPHHHPTTPFRAVRDRPGSMAPVHAVGWVDRATTWAAGALPPVLQLVLPGFAHAPAVGRWCCRVD